MKILCTFPGKIGDLLWALPSLRAIAESLEGTPVDLVVGAPYGRICALITKQTYVRQAIAYESWPVQDTAPMSPREPDPAVHYGYDHVFHLGYRGWPAFPLPYETYDCLRAQWPADWPSLRPLDLSRPWITSSARLAAPPQVALGWTDEWFELKVGLTALLLLQAPDQSQLVNVSWSPRWQHEWWEQSWGHRVEAEFALGDWVKVAGILSQVKVFCGDCSALHVLACAVGTPVVVMEPNPHRHHEVFYPSGTGGVVRLVRGMDGLPTFDARHTWDVIQEILKETDHEDRGITTETPRTR